jgi:hypothetical protein
MQERARHINQYLYHVACSLLILINIRHTRLIVIRGNNYAKQEIFCDHDPSFIKLLEVLSSSLTFVFMYLTGDETRWWGFYIRLRNVTIVG